jgi:ATP-dependent DNA helicase RecG
MALAELPPWLLSTQAAMECLKLTHRPSFLANYLRPALETGLVEMTHPDSPKSPTQKYRLKRTS